MIARKSGCFVNIASVARLFPYNWAGSYSVVKAGLIMLTRLMALEWTPPYGIRANAIAPGYIRTLGTEGMYAVITSACRDAASPAAASTERVSLGAPLVEMGGIAKTFGAVEALRGAGLTLGVAEVLGSTG